MAGRWIRPTRGTLAAITALVKNKPGRLLASIRDATVGNRRLWVEQVDGSLKGLAWLDDLTNHASATDPHAQYLKTLKKQIFEANGTFTVPAGVTQVIVSLSGGGGGGAGAVAASPYTPAGGGAGGVIFRDILAVTPGEAINVTIGAGGNGGLGHGGAFSTGTGFATSNGSSGGITSFGSLRSASGGGGGHCQALEAIGGVAGSGQYSANGGSGNKPWAEAGGDGGGNLFGPTNSWNHHDLNGKKYGAGGAGGRGMLEYMTAGGSGAPGVCIVEWFE